MTLRLPLLFYGRIDPSWLRLLIACERRTIAGVRLVVRGEWGWLYGEHMDIIQQKLYLWNVLMQ